MGLMANQTLQKKSEFEDTVVETTQNETEGLTAPMN